MLEMGGRELVMTIDRNGDTALHCCACYYNSYSSMEIIFRLLEMGGRELLMMKNSPGNYGDATALHCICQNKNASIEAISKMLELGGRELVMMIDEFGDTALHYACSNENASIEIISKMLEMGGWELLKMSSTNCLFSALYRACENVNASIQIISQLLEMGGRELLMMEVQQYGVCNALHSTCANKYASMEVVISKMLEMGGRALLMTTVAKDILHYTGYVKTKMLLWKLSQRCLRWEEGNWS